MLSDFYFVLSLAYAQFLQVNFALLFAQLVFAFLRLLFEFSKLCVLCGESFNKSRDVRLLIRKIRLCLVDDKSVESASARDFNCMAFARHSHEKTVCGRERIRVEVDRRVDARRSCIS